MRTMISSVCPKCGTIGKLRKRSCCGRGGSWFKNCGSTGHAKLDHTWYEGIQACKAAPEQPTLALGQPQLNHPQQKRYYSFSSNVGAVAAKTLKFAFVDTSKRLLRATPTITPVYTQANVPINSATRMATDTSMSMNASVQPSDITSITYDNDITNAKPISGEVTRTISALTDTLKPKPSIDILISTYINKSMATSARTQMTNTSLTNTSNHMPRSAATQSSSISITTQQCDMLLKTGVLLIMVL